MQKFISPLHLIDIAIMILLSEKEEFGECYRHPENLEEFLKRECSNISIPISSFKADYDICPFNISITIPDNLNFPDTKSIIKLLDKHVGTIDRYIMSLLKINKIVIDCDAKPYSEGYVHVYQSIDNNFFVPTSENTFTKIHRLPPYPGTYCLDTYNSMQNFFMEYAHIYALTDDLILVHDDTMHRWESYNTEFLSMFLPDVPKPPFRENIAIINKIIQLGGIINTN